MPTYSIIIPVYNAEKYLDCCMESILTQSKESHFEVILVDDGSSDRSADICDRYAQQSACVKVIHQANQGVSAARNAGIDAAGGAYILFLDSDDCWDPCLLHTLDKLIPQQPDIIEFGFQSFGGNVTEAPVLPAVEITGKTGIEYVKAHDAMDCMPIGSCWAAAFRKELLDRDGISFPLGVSYGEDLEFHMHCLKHARSVYSVREPLYRYRMNESGITHNPTVKKARDVLGQCAKVYRLLPYTMVANYYCLIIPYVTRLSKREAKQLNDLLRENRDILRKASGRSAQIARVFYGIFGWYYGSRLINFAVKMRYAKKG